MLRVRAVKVERLNCETKCQGLSIACGAIYMSLVYVYIIFGDSGTTVGPRECDT